MIKSLMINGNSIMQTHKAISFYNTHYNGHTHQNYKFVACFYDFVLFCFVLHFSLPVDWRENIRAFAEKRNKRTFSSLEFEPFQNMNSTGSFFLSAFCFEIGNLYKQTDRPNNKWFETAENDTLMCYFVSRFFCFEGERASERESTKNIQINK